MDMPLNSTEKTPSLSAQDKKENGEKQHFLTAEQVRVGTNVIMSHAERQKFWQNSAQAELLGFKDW
jgi:hypothetical protein